MHRSSVSLISFKFYISTGSMQTSCGIYKHVLPRDNVGICTVNRKGRQTSSPLWKCVTLFTDMELCGSKGVFRLNLKQISDCVIRASLTTEVFFQSIFILPKQPMYQLWSLIHLRTHQVLKFFLLFSPSLSSFSSCLFTFMKWSHGLWKSANYLFKF